MRRNLLVAVLVSVGLILGMWGVTAAQGQNGRPATQAGAEARVALVDVAYVFKNYNKFNGNYEVMKKEVKQREQEIVEAQNELKNYLTQKQQFTPESQNSKQIDQKIAQKKAELEILAANSRQEFTQKEASLYHQTYQEVEAVIRQYAERNGIMLVLRASRDDESSSANPQEVIKEVSQQVIYALPGMDITEKILATLNAQSPPANEKKAGPTGPTRTTPKEPTSTGNKLDSIKPTGKPGTKKN